MQQFFKNNEVLRMVLIAVLFVLSFVMLISGWKMTGQLAGLGIMIVGVFVLVLALMIYNAPFTDPKNKK